MVVASTSELKLNLTLNRMIKSILFPDFLELIIVIQGPATSCIASRLAIKAPIHQSSIFSLNFGSPLSNMALSFMAFSFMAT